MPAADPSDRVLIARLAAHESWAQTPDRAARTAPAKAAAEARWEKQVDPEGKLPPEQRRAMAASAKKAFHIRIGRMSGQARRAKAKGKTR